MPRIATLIERSGWAENVVIDAVSIIGGSLNIAWIEYLDQLISSEEFTEEGYWLENIVQSLLRHGTALFEKMGEIEAPLHDISYQIASQEEQIGQFARKMSKIRRKVTRALDRVGYTFSDELGIFDIWLDEMFELLVARNASPESPLMEENCHGRVSEKEKEKARQLIQFISQHGWQIIPLGEREETILCLCQHLYSIRDFSTASEFLVGVTETGVQDPLIYYNYFMIGLAIGEFEPAMQGYQIAARAQSKWSLAPSDRYTLLEVIEKNRFFLGFSGQDLHEQRPVLVKVLINPPENVRKAIINAFKLKKYPGIAELYKFYEVNELRPCFAMQYLEGPSLREYIRQHGPMPRDAWQQNAIAISESLAYAHEEGVVHGSLDPDKLIFHQGQLKLIDFGISPLADWPIPFSHGELAGICFIAPELLQGEDASTASDVYSLAMTLYFMLTGSLPHPLQIEKIPAYLRSVFKKASEKRLDLRYTHVGEFLTALTQEEGDDVSVVDVEKSIRRRMIVTEGGEQLELPEDFLYQDGVVYSQKDNGQLVLVPAGAFTMGSEEKDDEMPGHQVFLGHYLIDKYPVTNAQYACFLDYIHKTNDHSQCHPAEPSGKNHTPKNWKTPDYLRYSGSEDSPVIFVDWWDAWAYAAWAGKTLPSEAQWEKSARGGDLRRYPWGDEKITGELANYGNMLRRTTPVGLLLAGNSPYGCQDMAGNVWEWCHDTYDRDFYQSSPEQNPLCSLEKKNKIARGGAWNSGEFYLRTSSRSCWVCVARYSYIGFRCARVLSGKE